AGAFQLAHDAGDRPLDALGIDVALAKRDIEGTRQLVAVEGYITAGFLHDHEITKLDALERGEASAAIGADAPPANGRAIFRGPGILHLRIFGLAIGTAHDGLWIGMDRDAGRRQGASDG